MTQHAAPSTPGPGPGARLGPAYDAISVCIMAGLVFVAFATFRDYGITWDETWHMDYGQYIFEWYRTGFEDRTALSYRGDYLYGGGFDGIGGLLVRAIPMKWHEVLHLYGSMVGIVGILGAWKLGRLLAGPAGGMWTVILLVTTPVYYGHMFNNPKDLPFAAGYVWALYYLAAVAQSLPRVSRSLWIKLSVASGAALSVRVGGLLLHCYLLALFVVFVGAVYLHTRGQLLARRLAWNLAKRFGAVLGGAWLVMLVFWPWAILDPIRRPFFALGRMTRFNLHVRQMPFGDEQIWTYDVPWDYLIRYFGLKVPEMVLLLSVAAGVGAIHHAVRNHLRSEAMPRLMRDGVLFLAIVFPPVYAMLVGSTLYDGLRHFLFLIPPMCAVGASALVGGMHLVRVSTQIPGWTLAGVVILLSAQQVGTMRELHPHQYTYFNRIAGGLPGVYKRYDTDYYGNGYKEAVRLIQERLWTIERNEYLNRRYRLQGCIPSFIVQNYLPANLIWKRAADKNRAHFHLGYQRAGCHDKHDHRPIFTQVERQGTPLIIVREMRTPGVGGLDAEPQTKKPASKKKPKNRAKKNNRDPSGAPLSPGLDPLPGQKPSGVHKPRQGAGP